MKFVPSMSPGEGSAVLPDGEHPFEVSNAEEKESKSSGNDMIEVALKFKDGPTVYDYLIPGVAESEWKIVNFLSSIGEDVKPGVPVDLVPDRLIGRRGIAILYTDTYQGKKKNKVADYVIPISGPDAKPPASPPKDKWR
ncbi:MAG: hypothetical protein WB586_05875 [Chthoniobacterales bacterium]